MVKGSYKDETTEREEIVRKRGGGNCREIEKGIFTTVKIERHEDRIMVNCTLIICQRQTKRRC